MKKILAITFSIILLCCVTFMGSVVADNPTIHSPDQVQEVPVYYTVNSEFIVTIPTTIDIGGSQSIGISKAVLRLNECLNLSIDAGDHKHNTDSRQVCLVDSSTDEHHLKYNLYYTSTALSVNKQLIGIDEEVCIMRAIDQEALPFPYLVPIVAELVSNQNHVHSGQYADSVTITVGIETISS